MVEKKIDTAPCLGEGTSQPTAMANEQQYMCGPKRGPLNRFGWQYVESRGEDANFMDLAYMLARNSEAKDGHMGCCFVRGLEVVVEAINAPLFGEARSDIHAEASAICEAARRGLSLDGASLYVTRAPCSRCYRLIVFAGIAKIVAPNAMADKEAISADALGIKYTVLRDDEERACWRRELAERHRDEDVILRARARRKLLKQQKTYGCVAPVFSTKMPHFAEPTVTCRSVANASICAQQDEALPIGDPVTHNLIKDQHVCDRVAQETAK